MADELIPKPATQLLSTFNIADALEQARDTIAEHSLSENTRLAYQNEWKLFEQAGGHLGCGPEFVLAYLTRLAEPEGGGPGRKVSGIRVARAAIGKIHEGEQLLNPVKHPIIAAYLRALARKKGVQPIQKKALIGLYRRMLDAIKASDRQPLIRIRDRALLMLGQGTGMRRSELVSLNTESMQVDDDTGNAQILLARSKTDQTQRGVRIKVAGGIIAAVRRWMVAAGITAGPIFRPVDRHGNVRQQRLTPDAVAVIVKRWAAEAGATPEEVERYAGHSLRRGFITNYFRKGVPLHRIRERTRHAPKSKVFFGYIEEEEAFQKDEITRIQDEEENDDEPE